MGKMQRPWIIRASGVIWLHAPGSHLKKDQKNSHASYLRRSKDGSNKPCPLEAGKLLACCSQSPRDVNLRLSDSMGTKGGKRHQGKFHSNEKTAIHANTCRGTGRHKKKSLSCNTCTRSILTGILESGTSP